MPFVNTACHDFGIYLPKSLYFGTNETLWFLDGAKQAVASIGLNSLDLTYHFAHSAFCTFQSVDELAAVGTVDGRLLTFRISEAPLLSSPIVIRDGVPVDAIDIDVDTGSLFLLCDNAVFLTSMDGQMRVQWKCSIPAFCIKWVKQSRTVWAVCNGIEIISPDQGKSSVFGKGRLCPYVDVAVSKDGEVACFGGNTDIFTPWGQAIRSIGGGFNGGTFDVNGRLIAQRVTREYSEVVSVTPYPSHDEVSMCNCVAIDRTGSRLAAFHRGKLFLFSRS